MKKSKLFTLLLCFVLFVSAFCGCNRQQPPDNVTENSVAEGMEKTDKSIDLDIFPMNMVFAGGAGGWRTQITLKEDGTFVGDYYDSDAVIPDDDYDYTVYVCEFNGKYEIVEQIDDYSYSLKITETVTEKNVGAEWTEDRIHYIYSEPYGVNTGGEYILYTDEMPIESLSEEIRMGWWPYRFNYKEENIETLSCCCLYNKEDGIAFFSAE